MSLVIASAPDRRVPTPVDGMLDMLAKLIPGEVLVGYTAALVAVGDAARGVHVALLVGFAALAPVILYVSARRARDRAAPLQYAVRALTLVLWACAIDPVLLDLVGTPRWMLAGGAAAVPVLAAVVLTGPRPTR